jgi:GTP-binding protein EngB required for normal cell division/uncharacterized protein (DUF697 family)
MSVQNYSNYSNEMLEKLLTETTDKGEALRIIEELDKRFAEEIIDSINSTSKKEPISSDDVIKDRQSISKEIAEIEAELKTALEQIIEAFGKRLKPNELQEIKQEFAEIEELLKRLKEGLIWVTLFGKTSAGKSATLNSLIGEDLAEVDVKQDASPEPKYYKKEPWYIVDVPGILGKKNYSDIAIKEAKLAAGIIFVVDGEPLEDELKLFNLIHEAQPSTPKIVFVNKLDVLEFQNSDEELSAVKQRVSEKMQKFVPSSSDIVYGSAQIKDPITKKKVRQDLPQLLDLMYANTGELGVLMNILDPAKRVSVLSDSIQKRILETREKTARKFIEIFAKIIAYNGIIPFATVVTFATLLPSMVWGILLIMGKPLDKDKAKKLTGELTKMLAIHIKESWLGIFAAEVAIDVVSTATGWFGFAIAGAADVAVLSGPKYNRTAVLGELTLEYIKNNFDWGTEKSTEIIKRCQARAEEKYKTLSKELNLNTPKRR